MSQSQTVGSGSDQEDCRFDDLLAKLEKAGRQLWQVCVPEDEAAELLVAMTVKKSDFMVIPSEGETVWFLTDDPALASLTSWPLKEVTSYGARVVIGRCVGEIGMSDRWQNSEIANYGSRFPRLWPGNLHDEEAGRPDEDTGFTNKPA